MTLNVFLVFLLVSCSFVKCSNEITTQSERIDSSFLENALDAQECHRQIRAIRSNSMLFLQFTDTGLRTPRGILTGNTVDMGNYHQCIGINRRLENMHIEGKYCSIMVPFNQSLHLPRPQDMQPMQFDPTYLQLDNETITKLEEYNLRRKIMLAYSGELNGFEPSSRTSPDSPLSGSVFRLAVCVPKPCTTQQAITSLLFNVTAVGFQYTEDYCRLPGDKPWIPADYVAVVFFALLGFVTLLSTSYDLSYRFLLKKDVKQMNVLCRSFSVYTNGQRLTTFSTGGGTLQCLDGIRTLAMVWVIVGHSYSTIPFIANPLDSSMWMLSADALWVTVAPMTVDTFFTLAGVLLVYTTASKMNQISFLKNLHWFYLSRYIRVTPLLAVTVLLQTSYFNRFTDGPHWVTVTDHTKRCRENWWATLLHVQNFVYPDTMCVTHSWYTAIDFQLYFLSPLILIWVLSGKKYIAWIGLIGGLAAVLIASTIYNFHLNLQAGVIVPSRTEQFLDYFLSYYFNTLTRASPFFVGLVFGYILHIYRKDKLQIHWSLVIFLWACFAGILGGIFYFTYRIKDFSWDNQLVDNLMNSFMRPGWACAICWLIIACVYGYGGPINWFLCLDIWRLPARLAYGMFLFHYPLMYTLNGTIVAPVYFSVGSFGFRFLSYLVLAVVYSFFFTLVVDSPITVLFKILMDSGKKNKPAPREVVKQDNSDKNVISSIQDKNMNNVLTKRNEDKVLEDGDSKSFSGESNINKDNFNRDDSKSNNGNGGAVTLLDASLNEKKSKSNANFADSNIVSVDSNSDNVVRIDDSGIHVYSESVPEVNETNANLKDEKAVDNI